MLVLTGTSGILKGVIFLHLDNGAKAQEAYILTQYVGQLLLAQQICFCAEGFLDQALPLHAHGQPDGVRVLLELHEDVVSCF